MLMRLIPTVVLVSLAASTAPNPAGAADPGFPEQSSVLVINVDNEVLIGGDGSVYRRDRGSVEGRVSGFAMMAPPLPPLGFTVAHLSPEGMQQLYDLADGFDLFADETAAQDNVEWFPDEGATSVTVDRGDGPVAHYRPNHYEDEPNQPRYLEHIEEFADAVLDLESFLDENDINVAEPYVPEQWIVTSGFSDHPFTLMDWPRPEPPEIDTCVELPTSDARDTATGGYVHESGDQLFVIFAEPVFPWTEC